MYSLKNLPFIMTKSTKILGKITGTKGDILKNHFLIITYPFRSLRGGCLGKKVIGHEAIRLCRVVVSRGVVRIERVVQLRSLNWRPWQDR